MKSKTTTQPKEEAVLLHVCDWNLNDKYYRVPYKLMKEFRDRLIKELKAKPKEDPQELWEWFTNQVKYDKTDKGPIRFLTRVSTNEIDDAFMLDWCDFSGTIEFWGQDKDWA